MKSEDYPDEHGWCDHCGSEADKPLNVIKDGYGGGVDEGSEICDDCQGVRNKMIGHIQSTGCGFWNGEGKKCPLDHRTIRSRQFGY